MRFFRVLTLIARSHKPKMEVQFPLDLSYTGLRVRCLRPTTVPLTNQPINPRFDGEPLCGSESLGGHWRSPSHVPREGGKFSDSAKSTKSNTDYDDDPLCPWSVLRSRSVLDRLRVLFSPAPASTLAPAPIKSRLWSSSVSDPDPHKEMPPGSGSRR